MQAQDCIGYAFLLVRWKICKMKDISAASPNNGYNHNLSHQIYSSQSLHQLGRWHQYSTAAQDEGCTPPPHSPTYQRTYPTSRGECFCPVNRSASCPFWQSYYTLQLGQCLTRSRVLFRRRHWHPTPVLLPGKSHGRRSLVGCSPCGCQESDTTERLHFHFSLSCIGEGNGNPLQCSCLENPRDGGAWWAAVCGVAQSRTRLKRLSSSSRVLFGKPNHERFKNISMIPLRSSLAFIFMSYQPLQPPVFLPCTQREIDVLRWTQETVHASGHSHTLVSLAGLSLPLLCPLNPTLLQNAAHCAPPMLHQLSLKAGKKVCVVIP